MSILPTDLAIRRHHARPQPRDYAALANATTCMIADARGKAGALGFDIRPQTSVRTFCGPALTVQCPPRDNFAPWAGLIAAQAGDVLVVATASQEDAAIVGDHFAGMARKHGIAAIVTDGMIRDIRGIEALGLPVFARGITPESSDKQGNGRVGIPVRIGRQTIAPGDLLVGDDDGVVVVPLETIADTVRALEDVQAREQMTDALVHGPELYPLWLAEVLNHPNVREL